MTESGDPDTPFAGVSTLDHTADVGIEVVAEDPGELFLRAAQGLAWLVFEQAPGPPVRTLEVTLAATDMPSLLRTWLRELLFRLEAEGFIPVDATFRQLEPDHLAATVEGASEPGPHVREIKGVTLHALTAERRQERWYARVIFDV